MVTSRDRLEDGDEGRSDEASGAEGRDGHSRRRLALLLRRAVDLGAGALLAPAVSLVAVEGVRHARGEAHRRGAIRLVGDVGALVGAAALGGDAIRVGAARGGVGTPDEEESSDEEGAREEGLKGGHVWWVGRWY